MFAEIISIGDEILIGQIVNNNAAWMAQQLNLIGIPVRQISTVGDDKQELLRIFSEASQRADIILITGGLGPTSDDITKPCLCEFFHTKLVFKPEIFEQVKEMFSSRNIPMPGSNRGQAEIPENCIPIQNKNGTAPGMWFEAPPRPSPLERENEPDYFTAEHSLYSLLKEKSESMRNNPTEGEKAAWELFRANRLGFHIRRQHIIGNFIVDFVNIKTKTIIEIDGDIHDHQKAEDEIRTEWLQKHGFNVIRFKNNFVIGNPDGFCKKVIQILQERNQKVLPNGEDLGGASIWISLPGVPYEMKAMMNEFVIPQLKKRFQKDIIVHKTVYTQGVGESTLAEKIKRWEDSLPVEGIKLAYLPSPGMVKLRLSAKGNDKRKINRSVDKKISELQKIIPDIIYAIEDFGNEPETLEKVIGELLRAGKKTLAVAESCSGGYIAHLITSVAGSSDYFKGGIIAYSNEIKTKELNVDLKALAEKGAVSKEVAEQMAEGIRKKMNVDFGISTTGIAGPTGGSEEKPVGTVWIAVSAKKKIVSEKFSFGNNRERNIRRTALSALTMLRHVLKTHN